MNRRNTIIIAVLVNAGLLLVLFATAMRSGDKNQETSVQLAEAPIVPKETFSTPVTTEELLNEYIAAAAPCEQEDVIVLEDLVNGTNFLETPIATTPSVTQQVASSMPAITPPANAPVVSAPAAKPQTPKPQTTAATVKETATEVTVKKGEYLEKIAKAHNTTVDAIMQANHLSSSNLKVGQVLKIPGKAKSSAPASVGNVATSTSPAKDFYVVKEGDSPWLIASKCNVKLDELLRMNNIDEQKAKKLRPGDKLRIR